MCSAPTYITISFKVEHRHAEMRYECELPSSAGVTKAGTGYEFRIPVSSTQKTFTKTSRILIP